MGDLCESPNLTDKGFTAFIILSAKCKRAYSELMKVKAAPVSIKDLLKLPPLVDLTMN